MKKKNNNNKRKIQYLRRDEVILNGISFKLTTPSPSTHFVVNTIGNEKMTDRIYYEFVFKPPLEKLYAVTTTIEVTHIESKRTDTRIVILPETDDHEACSFGNTLRYIEFNTHVVRIQDDSVYELFLCLLNTQLRGDISVPILVPDFNYNLGFFPKMFPNRFERLSFYPYNIDISDIDFTKIPVMLPINGKPLGGLTGSQVPKLLGYYAGSNDTSFTGWKGAAVRFGTVMEPIIILLYMAAHPDFKYKQPGWWAYKDHIADGTWTDGIITDEQGNVFGLECKASQNNCNFEGPHIAQCVWSMACGNTQWHDLVKYGQKSIRVDNIWSKIGICKETRILRNKDKEKELIDLCFRSKQCKNQEEFLKLISTEPYINMRAYMDNMAEKANGEFHKNIEIKEDMIQQLHEYKNNAFLVQEKNCVGLHPIIDRIEKRQATIFALFQEENKEAFRKEACDQLKDYSELIKDSITF